MHIILDVVKRNPLFLHEIEWKNNGFLFTTLNIFNIYRVRLITYKSDYDVIPYKKSKKNI